MEGRGGERIPGLDNQIDCGIITQKRKHKKVVCGETDEHRAARGTLDVTGMREKLGMCVSSCATALRGGSRGHRHG